MKLIIAEKPSVAHAIASVIGAVNRKDGFLEGNGYRVSWCYGHLCGLAQPVAYNPDYEHWVLEHLPIVPNPFKIIVQKDKQAQFNLLKKLMLSPDVTEVINACDAGREGELIFRSVYYLAGCRKPMKRLWISSMEDAAIREGMDNLLPGEKYNGLYTAALSRMEADWLVGINASRFFSLKYRERLRVGRVMSPTLAMVARRADEIAAFRPENYYSVQLELNGFYAMSEKMKDKLSAQNLADACKGPAKVLRVEQKKKSETAPALYDLTTLQRDANRLLGYTAQQTLDYLQSLYEKKLCTYPRTDSRYLTDDMENRVPEYVGIACRILDFDLPLSINGKQVCNSMKVSDHHAILPTMTAIRANIEELPDGEKDTLKLVCLGLVRAVSEPYRFMDTVVTLDCNGNPFTAKGRAVQVLGWMYYQPGREKKNSTLPDLEEGQELPISEATVKEGQTTPPKSYTEDTLLSAMENAGAKDMPEEAERKGLGTPATRAEILEKLISGGYMVRQKGKKAATLVPTEAGKALIAILPEQLKSPQLTAEWEHRLLEMEQRKAEPKAFLDSIASMLSEMFRDYQAPHEVATMFKPERKTIGKCPRCGGNVVETNKGFFCENQGCKFGLWKNNRFFEAKKVPFTAAMASVLLRNGAISLNSCVSEKTGKTYNADVILKDDGEKTTFEMQFPRRGRQ